MLDIKELVYTGIYMKFIICFIILISLSGCILHSGPDEDIHFVKIKQLKNVSGSYINKGKPYHKLSYIVFGYDPIYSLSNNKKIDHENIDIINISTHKDIVQVEAIEKECIVYKKEYILDKDFKIEDGKIILKSEFHSLSRGPGDLLLGPSYEKIEIGLDENNNGAYRSQEYIAGLAVLIIPIAGSSTSDVRFKKLDVSKKYSTCYTH